MILNDSLAHALGCSHYVGGIYRFVGGNHHKSFNSVFFGKLNGVECTEHVVFDCLAAVMLHKGHVLVSCRMENHLRSVYKEYLFKSRLVAYRKDLYVYLKICAVCDTKLLLNVISIIFISRNTDQFSI